MWYSRLDPETERGYSLKKKPMKLKSLVNSNVPVLVF